MMILGRPAPVGFTLMIMEGELIAHKQKVLVEASTLAEVIAALESELTVSKNDEFCIKLRGTLYLKREIV